jgi:hypothetical protein
VHSYRTIFGNYQSLLNAAARSKHSTASLRANRSSRLGIGQTGLRFRTPAWLKLIAVAELVKREKYRVFSTLEFRCLPDVTYYFVQLFTVHYLQNFCLK